MEKIVMDPEIRDFVLHKIMTSATSHTNSALFSSGDIGDFNTKYMKFLQFIKSSYEPYYTELTYLVYPLFVHFYLEMIQSGATEAAKEFLKSNSNLFQGSDEYASKVSELSTILSVKDLKCNDYFLRFREHKFIVKLSNEALTFLNVYLTEKQCTTILYFLNLYFSIETDVGEGELNLNHEPSKDDAKETNECEMKKSKDETSQLLESLYQNMAEEPLLCPSICVCNLTTNFRLTTAQLSSNCSIAAGGFDESHISIWNLSSNGLCSVDSQMKTAIVLNPNSLLQGHSGPVNGLSFAPNADLLFSCSRDTTVIAWNLSTHNNVAQYFGHNSPIWDVDVSSLSLYFATGSVDGTARIWSPDRSFPLNMLSAHCFDVNCVKFHPNCNYLATGSSDTTVRLWDIQNNTATRLFVGHRARVKCLSFSPDGKYLATGSADQTVKIWDMRKGTILKDLCEHNGSISNLSFNADGSLLATGATDNTIKLWDMTNFQSLLDENASVKTDLDLKSFSFGYKNILMTVACKSSCL